nr:hypothetical protein [Acidovorax temperans]
MQLVAEFDALGAVDGMQGQVAHQANELIGMAFVDLLRLCWLLPDSDPGIVGITNLFSVGGRSGLLWRLRMGERVQCWCCIQAHHVAALPGVLHAQREGSPLVGQGLVHDLQKHELMASVLGHDFRRGGVPVLLRAIFQPLGQNALG